MKAASKFMPENKNGSAAESAPSLSSALVQAASEMVAVTHFSGCIDRATAEARDNLDQALELLREQDREAFKRFHIRNDDYGRFLIYPWCPLDKCPAFHAHIAVNSEGEVTFNGDLKNVTQGDWAKFIAAMEIAIKDAESKGAWQLG